ncbi:ubiquinol-cytochrome-c reductase complex assembly factor 1-like [Montipora foliosa]|uniref:ubiquinol-cytochrome-c reductase complex assembly factor 1-like n=1 Tax=Montipora foliosa TaxID=591990 RepID=UPI0035F18E34
MHLISSKLLSRSSVTMRRLCGVWNVRAFQIPLSCSSVRHKQLSVREHSSTIKMFHGASSCVVTQNTRLSSTVQGSGGSVNTMEEKRMSSTSDTMIDKIISFLRFIAAPMVKNTVLIGSAKSMYQCCVDGMNFEEFFEACELPDTFQSWFIVLHLHIWMCLVRLKAEGKDGRFLYRKLVEMMWFDIEERMKNLGTIDSVVVRDNMRVLLKQFYGLTIALDEGLLCDDTVLATALWRNMFYNKKRTDAEALGRLVEYVRKNIQHLETLPADDLLYGNANFSWLPFKDEENKEENVKLVDTE